MGFDVRAFVAIHLGCEPSEVVLVAGPTSPIPHGQSASYARRPSTLAPARVLVGPRRHNIRGQMRRLVTLRWGVGGQAHTDIGLDDHLDW